MKLVITKFGLNSPISWGVSFDLYCTKQQFMHLHCIVNLDENSFDMRYKNDCWATIPDPIWMTNVPFERKTNIYMLLSTHNNFMIFFSILRDLRRIESLFFFSFLPPTVIAVISKLCVSSISIITDCLCYNTGTKSGHEGWRRGGHQIPWHDFWLQGDHCQVWLERPVERECSKSVQGNVILGEFTIEFAWLKPMYSFGK